VLCALYDELVEAEEASHEGDPEKKFDDIKTHRHVFALKAIWERLSPITHNVPIDASLAGCLLRIVERSPEVAVMVRSYAQALVSEAWSLVLFAVVFDDRDTNRAGVSWQEQHYTAHGFDYLELAERFDDVVALLGGAAGSPDVGHAVAHLNGAARALRALARVRPVPDGLDSDRDQWGHYAEKPEAAVFEQLLGRVRLAKPILEDFKPLEHLLAGNILLEVPEFEVPDADEQL
jgi:hypothetical protein